MKLGIAKTNLDFNGIISNLPFEIHGIIRNKEDRFDDGYLFYIAKKHKQGAGYMAKSLYAHEEFISYVGRTFESYTEKELKEFMLLDAKEIELVENNALVAKSVLERADDI